MRALCVYSVVLLMIAASDVHAAGKNKKEAKIQYKLGEDLRNEGKYDAAYGAFLKSYNADQSFETLYDIAKIESSLEYYESAVSYFQRYLKEGGGKIDAGMRKIVENEIKRLQFFISKGMAKKRPASSALPVPAPTPTPTPEPEVAEIVEDDPMDFEVIEEEEVTPPPPPPPPVKSTSELQAEEAERIFQKAMTDYDAGDLTGAKRLFKTAYQMSPIVEAQYFIANCALAEQEYDEALGAFEKYLREGVGEINKDRRKEVNEEMDRIRETQRRIKKKLDGIEANNRGVRLNRQGRYAEAMVEFEHAYPLFTDYRVQMGIGNAFDGQKDYTSAIASWEKYLEEGGDKVSFEKREMTDKKIARARAVLEEERVAGEYAMFMGKARDLAGAEKHEEAITEFQAAYGLKPGKEPLLETANAQIAVKQYEAAVSTLTTCLTESDVTEAESADISKRIEGLEQTVARAQKRSRAAEMLVKGNEYKEIGAFEEAIKELNAAYELDTNYQILLSLAQCYAGVENYKQAVKTYNIYLSKAGNKIPKKERKTIRKEAARLHELSKQKPATEADDILSLE